MREIKFRAKHSSSGDWGYSMGAGLDIFFQFIMRKVLDPDTLGQYTGLKDKNGKEIYEGDIVKYHDDFYSDLADIGSRRHIVGDRLYIIFWHPIKASFWRKSVPGTITDPITSLDCEVIGNIYENPELLAKEKG